MNIPTEFCNFTTDNCMINQNNIIMNHLKSILFALALLTGKTCAANTEIELPYLQMLLYQRSVCKR